MEKGKTIKISLKVFICLVLLLLILILIIVGCGIKLFNTQIKTEEKQNTSSFVAEKNNEIETVKENDIKQEESSSVDEDLTKNETEMKESIEKKISSTSKVSDLSEEEIFKKVSWSPKFLSLIIDNKNFDKKEFLDEEIPVLLVERVEEEIFNDCSDNSGFYVSAKEDDIQKYAKKYFDKEINVDNIKDNDGMVKIEIPSGFGIRNFRFSKIQNLENGDYVALFNEEIEDSSDAMIYAFIFNYAEDGDIIYKGFVNGIPDGIIYK